MYQHARHERALGKVEIAHLDHPVRGDLLALERDHVAADLHGAEMHHRAAADRCVLLVGHDRDVGLGARLRVLVVVVGREQGNVISQVELLDAVLLTLMQVDRAGMGDGEHACFVDRSDRAVGFDVDEPVLDRRTTAEPDAGCGRAFSRPVHAPAARRELVGLHELAHRVVETVAEPAAVVGRERQLVRGARDLGAQHERVLRVHDRAFGRAARELVGMRDVPLVELVVAGHEHRGRPAIGAPRAPRLLPHRRQRSREAVEHHRIEAADVDAQLERVRGGDAEEAAAREVELELASLRREIAGAVRGDARAEPALGLLEQPRARVARPAPRRADCA